MSDAGVFTILIAALGGEGGGVLSNWLADAAEADGFIVQTTSVPGVAQRTGATTYYLEFFPGAEVPAGERPVMGLLPTPGEVDVVLASEIVEAGRVIFNGFVVPDRTTLIASTHRIYAISEKMAMGDGRIDTQSVTEAAQQLAKAAHLFDMDKLAQRSGSVINAVLLGALAGADAAPISIEAMKAAITKGGIAVEANLAGFEAGFAALRGEFQDEEASAVEQAQPVASEAAGRFPAAVREVLDVGLTRVTGYQNQRYGARYIERLEQVLSVDRAQGGEGQDFAITRECARYLALWMSYEDIIRVAEQKTRPERMAEIRAEVRAAPDQPVVITEFLKPGLEEWCSLMPAPLGRGLRKLGYALGLEHKLNIAMHIKTTSITGFTTMWLLSKLKWWRPMTMRFAEESALIDNWLGCVKDAAVQDYDLALEVTLCANLNKGYGETLIRGAANLKAILGKLPELARAPDAAARVKSLREAALADPERTALEAQIAELTQGQAA